MNEPVSTSSMVNLPYVDTNKCIQHEAIYRKFKAGKNEILFVGLCSSVAKHLHNLHKAIGSIPSTTKTKLNTVWGCIKRWYSYQEK
jgi:hypothetical protein